MTKKDRSTRRYERNMRRKKRHILNNPTFWIMSVLCLILITAPMIINSIDLNISNEWKNFIRFMSFDLFIGSSSYLLYLAFNYRIRAHLAVKIIFSVIYFVICGVILYLSFKAIKSIFAYTVFTIEFGYIFWTMFICTAIAFFLFNLFYSYCLGILNFLSMILIPVLTPLAVIVIIYLIICFFVGKLPDFNKILSESNISTNKAYSFTNEMGCQETVYSTDGKTFTHSDGSYAGTSDDGGETIHR